MTKKIPEEMDPVEEVLTIANSMLFVCLFQIRYNIYQNFCLIFSLKGGEPLCLFAVHNTLCFFLNQ